MVDIVIIVVLSLMILLLNWGNQEKMKTIKLYRDLSDNRKKQLNLKDAIVKSETANSISLSFLTYSYLSRSEIHMNHYLECRSYLENLYENDKEAYGYVFDILDEYEKEISSKNAPLPQLETEV